MSATVARVAGIALAVGALVTAPLALTASLGETPPTGVVADFPPSIVQSVDPASAAWQNGIRPGQEVVALSPADDPGGWALETVDAGGHHRTTMAAVEARLRVGIPFALCGAVAALLGAALLRFRRRRAELFSIVGLMLSAVALAGASHPGADLLRAAAIIAPPVWLSRWRVAGPSTVAVVLAVGGVVIGSTAVADALHSETGPTLELLEIAWIVLLSVVLLVGPLMSRSRLLERLSAIRFVDLAAGVLLVTIVILVQAALQPPPVALAVVVAGVVLAYSRARRALAAAIDRLFLAEMRERTALQAAERERARLSRELHDDPLQGIAGVILQLERRPELAAERETLRAIAHQLRGVATELHPPVLDDFGLVPAIEALVGTTGSIQTVVDIRNDAGFVRDRRPPIEVELAIYRIVQEAVANAVRHSGAARLTVRGSVATDEVALDVADDGRGLTPQAIEAAMRDGHLGVASMRRRAEAIDARLEHRSTPGGGTTVHVQWLR